jgi:hypothetical protein
MFWARSMRSVQRRTTEADVALLANEDEKRLAYYHDKKKFF